MHLDMGQDCSVPDGVEPTDEPGELQYVEDFLNANQELVSRIVDQLAESGSAEYSNETGHLSLVAHRHRWRSQWLEDVSTTSDGKQGTGTVRLSKDAFVPPQSSLRFLIAARLADMQRQSD
jgi:hypothetical protein